MLTGQMVVVNPMKSPQISEKHYKIQNVQNFRNHYYK